MSPDPPAKLTEKQKDCLRLVAANRNSKEIGRILGISEHTVDARLKAAMQRLGVGRRADAARLFMLSEGGEQYQTLIYQPPEVVPFADIEMVNPSLTTSVADGPQGDPEDEGGGVVIIDPPAQLTPIDHPHVHPALLLIFGSHQNGLNIPQRLLLISALTAALVMAAGAMVSGLESLSRFIMAIAR